MAHARPNRESVREPPRGWERCTAHVVQDRSEFRAVPSSEPFRVQEPSSKPFRVRSRSEFRAVRGSGAVPGSAPLLGVGRSAGLTLRRGDRVALGVAGPLGALAAPLRGRRRCSTAGSRSRCVNRSEIRSGSRFDPRTARRPNPTVGVGDSGWRAGDGTCSGAGAITIGTASPSAMRSTESRPFG